MNKPLRFPFAALLTVLAGLFLAGCSGLDDLRVVNNYPFAVVLRHKGGGLLTVPARTTLTFHGEGGYKGGGLENLSLEDAHYKPLQTLSQDSSNVVKQDGRINGAVTWNITLGPPVPAPSPTAAKPFSAGWFFAGAALFIGWIEWRAHRNEKSKIRP